MNKTLNNRAWFMVLPVLLLVAFNAIIPLMTVVNYSVQDTFGNNQFFWNGLDWFREVLGSDRIRAALGPGKRLVVIGGGFLRHAVVQAAREDDQVLRENVPLRQFGCRALQRQGSRQFFRKTF